MRYLTALHPHPRSFYEKIKRSVANSDAAFHVVWWLMYVNPWCICLFERCSMCYVLFTCPNPSDDLWPREGLEPVIISETLLICDMRLTLLARDLSMTSSDLWPPLFQSQRRRVRSVLFISGDRLRVVADETKVTTSHNGKTQHIGLEAAFVAISLVISPQRGLAISLAISPQRGGQ